MRKEAALTIGGAMSVVGALLALLRAFGVPLTADQQAAILGFAAVLAPWVQAWLTRQNVYSKASVEGD